MSKATRIAVYTGSFDPMTLGHLDVVRRAARLFDRLVIAIGEARGKAPLFTVAERVTLIGEVVRDLTNVEVTSFKGLAVNHAQSLGAVVMVRGLRSSTDYNYEVQMALMNRALAPAIETVFLPTSPQFGHISSSLAKEIALHGGDLDLLCPPLVSRKLSEKLQG